MRRAPGFAEPICEVAEMHAVVVYESLFGNTRDVAQAVATGVRTAWPNAVVECVCIGENDHEVASITAGLIVVGAPTHFWSMSTRISRAMEYEYELRMMRAGRAQGGEIRRQAAPTPGVRGWLAAIPPARGRPAAAFDTRMDRRFSGGAAPAIARRL